MIWKNISIFFGTVVMSLGIYHAVASDKIVHQFVDKHVTGIVIGEDRETKLLTLYGEGIRVQSGYGLCYSNLNGDEFVIFELGEDKLITGVIITYDSALWSQCKQKVIGVKKLTTGKKLELGISPEKVIEIYGPPIAENVKKTTATFEYHTDYMKDHEVRLFYDAYLRFKDSKLWQFSIHNGN